jgi:hypothetical protein
MIRPFNRDDNFGCNSYTLLNGIGADFAKAKIVRIFPNDQQ